MSRTSVALSPLALALILSLAACGEDPATGNPGGGAVGVDTQGATDAVFTDAKAADAADATVPSDTGSTTPQDTGATTPEDTGATTPEDTGATTPEDTGATTPEDAGNTTPDDAGTTGEDTSTATPDGGAGVDGGSVAGSCGGKCGKYETGASCQCDSGCKQFKDCCDDYATLCAEPGCKEDKDCDDTIACTTDTCDKVKGECANKLADKHCLIDNNCYKASDAGDKACLVCAPDKATDDWTPNTGNACDDANSCTSNDVCNESGACVGAPKANCCTKDSECVGDACKAGTCDLNAGSCTYKDKADCCSAGKCCDLAQNKVKEAKAQCGSEVAVEEFKCDGIDVQSRAAYNGCDGSKATCGTDKANFHWSPWKTVLTCKEGAKCVQTGSDKPICEAPTACKQAADCDDNNTCTKDICKAGKCALEVVAGCCNFASDCDDGNKCTTDLCDNNQCSTAQIPCKGASDCELASCDPKTGACSTKVKSGFCKIGDACVADGKLKDDAKCLACNAKANQSEWTPAAKCTCKSGVCCDAGAGVIKPKAAQCDDKVQAKKYQCDKTGSVVQIQEAFRGCTGNTNTCSVSKGNYAWGAWKPYKKCGANQFCEVATGSKPGVCKDKVTDVCKGTTCCIKGKLAPQKTKCGSTKPVKLQYKCSSTAKGAKVTVREAFAGCTGKSQLCSTSAANLSWGAVKTVKTCGATQVCKVGSSSTVMPTCVTLQQCKPGSTCCDSKGNFAPVKTKCGVGIIGNKYTCTSTGQGSDVLRSSAYGGCTGTKTTCSYLLANWHWSKPATYKDCKSPAKCQISNAALPGVCVTGGGVACDATDKWEPGTSASKALSFGSFNDNSLAKVLTPKMHFNSDKDLDMIKYKINDTSSTHRPVVHVEWSAAAPMNLCAWASCDKGAGGKNCKPIKCPVGFSAVQNSAVSGEKANGCCSTTWKSSGSLHFAPSATSGSNHTGWVYFSGRNAANVCQLANIKLQFGEKTATACKAGTTCCTSTGAIAAQKSKCDTKIQASEYQCSSNKLQYRRAYRGCLGSSAYCSKSKSNWSWTKWATLKSCKTTEVCSVTDKTKLGSCVPKADSVCKLADKYAGGTYYTTAYPLGSYTDESSAKQLAPEIIFNSSYDSEYFRYFIKDNVNFTNPRVHIEFEGADNVLMCAYYRCTKGPNSKNCAPVKCPAGTTPSYQSFVSSANANGCCMTAKKGTLSFSPDAPGTSDESGWVYIRAANTGKVCQKVKAKLVFGSKTSTQCKPNSACCTASGTFAPKTTKCSTTALESQYKCSSSLAGGDVHKRSAFKGCVGTSTFCSNATANRHWDAWKTYKNCSTSQVCSVPDTTKPGTCQAAVNPLCSKKDQYAAGGYYSSAYNLGSYNDTSAAKIVIPKILLNSKFDVEYFKYAIKDIFNTTTPRVNVEWTGSDKVKVCAYYRCSKGANGKDCKPVTCPSGTTKSAAFYVSSANPNGCCLTAAKGKIDFTPDASGTSDETGTAYLVFRNASNVCQEVSAKLQFGNKSATQCNPTQTCCGADGQYLKKNSKCGKTVYSKAYKCSSTNYGGDVLVRESFAGCTGFNGTSCSVSSSYRYWGAWKVLSNCSTSEVCSVPDGSKPGICKPSGNTAPLCKASDKYEKGKYYSSAYNLGNFKDNSPAIVINPDTHMGSTSDIDYYKWSIADSNIFTDPRVHVTWTASEPVYVCAWYACNSGKNGKNCDKVKCDKGAVSYSSYVSGTIYNGCCSTSAKGEINFKPGAPGTSETGWAYLRVWNKAKVCQYVNTKIAFGGATKVCGDGKKESGETNTTCKQDQGSCVGNCGKFVSGAACKCDAKCVGAKDCCWDYNLYCAK